LKGGRWVERWWEPNGRWMTRYDAWEQDCFELVVNGEALSDGWNWRGFREEGKVSTVTLGNRRGVEVDVNTRLDGTRVLTRWLTIRNTTPKPAAIESVFPWCFTAWAHTSYRDYPPGLSDPFVLGRFTRSDWSYEGWFEWEALRQRRQFRSLKGQGFDQPFFVLRNRALGEFWICHLAWSANWTMDFELRHGPGDFDSVVCKIGPWASLPLRVLSPGEETKTPAIHLGYVSGTLDEAVQQMHRHVRLSVLPKRKKERSLLVQYSVPGDQGYPKDGPRGLDEKTLMENVDLASLLGAEVFILDAGWWDVAGDWEPSRTRFPRGLEPVIDYARSKGLLFGLYAEIEGGRGNWEESKIYRAHPEWFGPRNVLDLGNPEVEEYVYAQLERLVQRYDLDLFRLDYNPLFTYEGRGSVRLGYQENGYWRYYEAFQRIFERIHSKYPDLILQQAAAGGARNGLGTSGWFHESYLTDGLRIPHVLQVFSGESLSLPPEVFVIGLGADSWPSRGHPASLETSLRTTFTLSTPWIFAGMVAPSVDKLDPYVRDLFQRYVKLYKEFIRPILSEAKIYHHSPVSSRGGVESSPWFAVEYSSPDRLQGWATIVRMGPSEKDTYLFKPRGLSPRHRYTVTFHSQREKVAVDGLWLVQRGIEMRLEEIGSSELLIFKSPSADH